MRIAELAGRRVAVLGYGREGRAAVAALRRRLPRTPVTVLTDTPTPAESLAEGVTLRRGGMDVRVLREFDVVIKSPGISAYSEPLQAAWRAGTRVVSGTSLWLAEHPSADVIAVTGTKGKSTTAALIAHLLRSMGRQVELAGNIGVPLLDRLDLEPAPDHWVVELSSYQTADLEGEPTLAVLLNLYPEHLDWHGGVERYYRDKLRVLGRTGATLGIVNAADAELWARLGNRANTQWFNQRRGIHVSEARLYSGQRPLFAADRLAVAGAHNSSNLAAALAVLQQRGVDPALAEQGVASFRGLPHRLTIIGERDGQVFVDDSLSTTPQCAMAAIDALTGAPLTLLVGGYDRGLDWTRFARHAVSAGVHAVITMPDNGPAIAERMRAASPGHAATPKVLEADSLAAAVSQARQLTPAGGYIVLSPGAPSFAEFHDHVERAAAFARAAGLSGA